MSGRSSFSKQEAPALLYPMFRKASELIQHNLSSDNAEQESAKKRARKVGSSNDSASTARTQSSSSIESAQGEPMNETCSGIKEEESSSQETSLNQKKNAVSTSHKQQQSNADATDKSKAEGEKPPPSEQRQLQRQQRHILHQLLHRSTTGSTIRAPTAAFKTWSPWALLQTSTTTDAVATCTAWDHVGVLLAVAFTNRTIHVYDWDVVARVTRHKQPIEPMCSIPTPHVVTHLQWDTHDCLVTCFRGSSQVRVYDVARVVESSTSNSSCWTILSHASIQSDAVTAHCLPRRQWLVSYRDGHLVLYKLKSNASSSVQWKWKHGNVGFTHVVPLEQTNHSVLLVHPSGSWMQLDWKTCTRAAFSTENSPTIIKRWNVLTSKLHGNVVSVNLERECPSLIECKYVTSNGWILNVTLDSTSTTSTRPRVLSAPPRVLVDTGDDTTRLPKESAQHYSQPLHPMAAHFSSQLLVWTTVQPVIHVLPHHDRRNVGGSLQVEHSRDSSVSIMMTNGRDGECGTVKVPLSCPTTCLTVHPSCNNEWLVVGNTQGELQVWTARDLSKRRKRKRRKR